MKTRGVVVWFLIVSIILANTTNICQSHRIGDLEQRMTTYETVRIEAVAPPEGVSP